jgi:hypothetical protein
MRALYTIIMTEPLTDINNIVSSFFDSFDNRKARVPNFDHFSNLFVEDSVIGNRANAGVTLWSLHDFWKPRNELLSNGRLCEFHEWETDSDTSIINGIAIRRSGYEKEGFLDGHPYAGVGTKFFQLALTPDDWRIVYLLWEDQE